YGNGKCNRADRVCSHRTYIPTRVANPLVPAVLNATPHHHVGNRGLIALICNDPHLHIPMYLFLGSLAFVDTWLSPTVAPKMLVNFFANSKMISLFDCKIQFFSLAICNHGMFFADNGLFTIFIVLVSYTLILFTILNKKSVEGIRKAFSTCGAQLLCVSLYYGPLLFMYVCPGSTQADDQDMTDSLFYTVIIPLLNPIIYSLRNKKTLPSEEMEKENAMLLIEFIFIGLTYQQKWQIPLLLVFLVIYLITVMGHLGLIALLCNDLHLHIPIYLFLGNLAFVDAWISSTMLVNFFAKSKMISLTEWKIQFFFFVISVTTKWFLLVTMAYDRYVTICKLLHYPVIITNRLSIQLLDMYCDIVPLFKISCTDPSINFLIVFIFSGSIQLCIILTVLVPYKVALFTILKKKSVQSIRKAFYTCGAHLLTISL
ncbi:hypothetical protein EI555_003892, partial [Monodon monoceros]